MKNNVSARIKWNRLIKEIEYKSINEQPKMEITFKQRGNKFVLHNMVVLSNGHSSRNLQHKLENITKFINQKYQNLLK